ncbi:methanogenesis marker protein Mmp4/MtxX [Methanotorris formicicus]|nr:methanogenesis marker protein Mmp4/MtxX [Methanotorris formicicus]
MYAIGIGEKKDEVLKAYHKLSEEGIDVELINNPKTLVDKLLNKEIDGAVRGSLSSSKVIPYLREKVGRFYRASILKNPFNREIFLLSPVGIDDIREDNEGRIKDKIELINYAINFLKRNNIKPKIALLSGGRLSDYGRSKEVDKTIEECEKILKYFKETDEKVDIVHNGILIEEVLKDGCNVIVAPDGISGNLMFRCFGLVCGLEGYGAVLLNNKEINFFDTSRNATWKRYYNAIKFIENINKDKS